MMEFEVDRTMLVVAAEMGASEAVTAELRRQLEAQVPPFCTVDIDTMYVTMEDVKFTLPVVGGSAARLRWKE